MQNENSTTVAMAEINIGILDDNIDGNGEYMMMMRKKII